LTAAKPCTSFLAAWNAQVLLFQNAVSLMQPLYLTIDDSPNNYCAEDMRDFVDICFALPERFGLMPAEKLSDAVAEFYLGEGPEDDSAYVIEKESDVRPLFTIKYKLDQNTRCTYIYNNHWVL
jgi:hypothetical protein